MGRFGVEKIPQSFTSMQCTGLPGEPRPLGKLMLPVLGIGINKGQPHLLLLAFYLKSRPLGVPCQLSLSTNTTSCTT